MANQTVITDTDMESVIALGLLSGENITINAGAILTCTETPSVLIGAIIINEGELFVDGLSISLDNVINFVGEGGLIDGTNDQTITVNGQGKLNITGDWFNIGTTDGTNSQALDLSTATGVAYWAKGGSDFCVDVIPMIQIETGRRIDYDTVVGTTPSVGDWIYLSSDRTIMGKVHSLGTGYLVVWCLTGALVDDDDIECRSVVDNFGPDLQTSWTAKVNNVSGDILESGVYTEFGNARSNGVDYISGFGHGLGGLVFHHAFQGTTLTLGSAVGGGFVPPSGCNIRVPNVIINTSSLTDEGAGTPYASGLAFGCATNVNETEWYALECTAGGEIAIDICNLGNAFFQDSGAFAFDASYMGVTVGFGSNIAGGKLTFDHCVNCQATEIGAEPGIKSFGGMQDTVNGGTITFCMIVNPRCMAVAFGGVTSIGIDVSDCISTCTGQGVNGDTSGNRGYNFSKVIGGSCINNLYFGNDNIEQDEVLNIATATDIIVEMLIFSMTQDYTQQTQEKNAINVNFTPNASIIGIEVIGDGLPGNMLIQVTDQDFLKVRGFGMIDDKVDFGSTDAELFMSLTGLCSNIDVARCWKDATGTVTEEFIVVPVTAKNILVQNCSGKYLSEIQPSGGDGIRFKGLHGGPGAVSSATGWEDVYLSSYGNSFHDAFDSDILGTIGCIMITPSVDNNETTITAGNPLFFKDGDMNMASGDVIEFEMGYFAKGHTGFNGTYTAAVGAAARGANEWANVTLDFQWRLDGGAWNGAWLDVRTVSNWTGITGAIEEGVKLKFRFTATGVQNDMSMLLISTSTTLTDQRDNFYPIDQALTDFTLTNVVVGSRYEIYNVDTATVLTSGTAATSTIEYSQANIANGTNIRIRVRKSSAAPKYIPYEQAAVVTNLAVNVSVSQVLDTIAG